MNATFPPYQYSLVGPMVVEVVAAEDCHCFVYYYFSWSYTNGMVRLLREDSYTHSYPSTNQDLLSVQSFDFV